MDSSDIMFIPAFNNLSHRICSKISQCSSDVLIIELCIFKIILHLLICSSLCCLHPVIIRTLKPDFFKKLTTRCFLTDSRIS